jgi:hypothetical protein
MTTDPSAALAQAGRVSAADFAADIGRAFSLIPTDGSGGTAGFAGASLASAVESPKSAMPGSPRVPFTLRIKVPNPGSFERGECMIEVPGFGTLGPIHVERSLPAASPDGSSYFVVQFN